MNLRPKINLVLVAVFLAVAVTNITLLVFDVNSKEHARIDEANSRIIGALAQRTFTDSNVFETGVTVGSYGFQGSNVQKQQEKFIQDFKDLSEDDLSLINIYDANKSILSSSFIDFKGRTAKSLGNDAIAEILSTGKEIVLSVNSDALYPTLYWGKPKNTSLLAIYYPVIIDEKIVGVVEALITPKIDIASRLQSLVAIYFLGLVCAFLLMSYLLDKSVIAPIVILQTRAQKIARGDYAKIPQKIQKDEIGRLIATFNDMAERIQESQRNITKKVLQIEGQNEELEKSKRATLNLLEDLNTEKGKLSAEKAKDDAVLASIGDGLVVVDTEGKILLVNNAFENLVGWKRKEVLGKLLVEVVQSEDEAGNIVPFKERILTKILSTTTTTTTTDWYYIRKDKTRFPVASIITPFILEGKIIGAVEVFRDITKEKEIDKAKTEFVSLASHQLRTPLTSINWYVEMLLAGDGGKITGDQKTFFDEIYRSSRRMVKLVNELLNVSRLETGRLKIEPKTLNLVELITDIIHEIEPWSNAWNRTIVFTPPAQPVCQVAVDPSLMRQVIHNVITNATRYSSPHEAEIRVTLQQTGHEYTVSIADDGIGIPQEAQSSIFQKFFRADNARVREAEGSGIGLYIAKMIVDASGGKLWFKSPTKPDGSGTTFYLAIPTTGMVAHDGEKGLA